MSDPRKTPLSRLGEELLAAFRENSTKAHEDIAGRISAGELDKNAVYAEGLKIYNSGRLDEVPDEELADLLDRIWGWCQPDYRL